MKKSIVVLIFGMSVAFAAAAKDRVIVNPVVDFANTGINQLTKVELGDKETRLYIRTVFLPHWWVKFPTTTYIEDAATGEKWLATGILNGEFDKEIFMPASGDSTFVLIFPKLDKKVKKINFCNTDGADESVLYGISLDPKDVKKSKEMPSEVQAWLAGEVANSKRKSLMDFKSGEFFAKDTARLVGYIKGYDPRAGFTTGMIYAGNVITREDYPVVIQIHEDGRFEGNIPMVFPEYLMLIFENFRFYFYIQPGETLSMVLDWDEFLTADRLRYRRHPFSNITYQGVSAQINKELTAFYAQLPELPYQKIYGDERKGEFAGYKSHLDAITADYTNQYKHLLETEKLSEQTRKILQYNYKMQFAYFLMDYEMDFGIRNREAGIKLPIEFYDLLQDIPMQDRELLSTPDFSGFINRFEFASPFDINPREERSTDTWRQKDSIYSEVLKLQPSIIYDITKVRSLDSGFKHWAKDQREDAAVFLNKLKKGIAEPFLKEEADRIFQKHFPLEKPVAYELPNTAAAKLFKDIIAPYKGKILFVDFWATTCGPCIYNIKQHKALRESYKGSKDIDFVFITAADLSPINAYNKFIEEQELTNTYRVSQDDYQYLRQLFKFNGIPRYVLVDREGRILNGDASAYSFEQDLKAILAAETTNKIE